MPSLELKVSGGFLDFTKNDMPVAQTARKKFDTVRREYDASIIKVQTLEKDKKPNQPKIQQVCTSLFTLAESKTLLLTQSLSSFDQIAS
jgi:hypothetical protein